MVYPWWSQRFSMFFHLRLDAFDAIFVQPLFVQLRPWTSWTRPSCSLDQFGVFVLCVKQCVCVCDAMCLGTVPTSGFAVQVSLPAGSTCGSSLREAGNPARESQRCPGARQTPALKTTSNSENTIGITSVCKKLKSL